LDGTSNFAHGIPFFAASIAFSEAGTVKAGAVYSPVSNELYYARKGAGAFLNGERIGVKARSLQEGLLSFGSAHWEDDELQQKAYDCLKKVGMRFKKIRFLGGVALELCLLAAGKLDAVLRFGQMPWDVAAGMLIAEEGGARITDLNCREWSVETSDFLAAEPLMYERVMNFLGD
jgi:myo-inositol-1(or 4)-monophosphatase